MKISKFWIDHGSQYSVLPLLGFEYIVVKMNESLKWSVVWHVSETTMRVETRSAPTRAIAQVRAQQVVINRLKQRENEARIAREKLENDVLEPEKLESENNVLESHTEVSQSGQEQAGRAG